MLNHVEIMGRLTRDPEMRRTQSDIPVASFSIACDRNYKSKDTGERGVDFFNVSAWRTTAEFVGKYLKKGRMVVVEGALQQRQWTDKDGNKRQAVEIKADNIYFADSKRDGDSAPADQGAGDGETYAAEYDGLGSESGEIPPDDMGGYDQEAMQNLPF